MKQIRIKESGPLNLAADSPENYGATHQAAISKATARGLCGMYPLPKIGYETCVAINVQRGARLYVANMSGVYVVRSSYLAVTDWPEVFGVTLERFEYPNLDGMTADELRTFYDANARRRNPVLRDLAAYAINKATAMRQREQGNVSGALQYERIADGIYAKLPHAAKW
jgi:hypothetical protein